MLTPFDIKDRIKEIKHLSSNRGDIGRFHARKLERDLFIEVLREIARGSIDPKSLAIEVLKTTSTNHK